MGNKRIILRKIGTAAFTAALLLLLSVLFCACGDKPADPSESPSGEPSAEFVRYTGNVISGIGVGKDGDLFYRYAQGEKTGKGYQKLQSANDKYSDYALLSYTEELTFFDCFLGQNEDGSADLIVNGKVYALPRNASYNFRLPFLVGTRTETVPREEDSGSANGGDLSAGSGTTPSGGAETVRTVTKNAYLSLFAAEELLAGTEEGGEVPLWFYETADLFYDEENGMIDVVTVWDGEKYVAVNAESVIVFTNENPLAVTQKGGAYYFKTYDPQTKKYTVYGENGAALLSEADEVADPDGYDYLMAVKTDESGEKAEELFVFRGDGMLSLGASAFICGYAESAVLYFDGENYGVFDGETEMLPYTNVVSNASGSCFLAYPKDSHHTVDLLDGNFNVIAEDLPDDVRLSSHSEPTSGFFAAFVGNRAYLFRTVAGGLTELTLEEDEALSFSACTGFVCVKKGESVRVFSAYTGRTSAAYRQVFVRQDCGVTYAVGIADGYAEVFDPNGVADSEKSRATFPGVSASEISADIELAANAADITAGGAKPVVCLKISAVEKTIRFAVTRGGFYGEKINERPLSVCEIYGEPAFLTPFMTLVTHTETGSAVYSLAFGTSAAFETTTRLTGYLWDEDAARGGYVYEENGNFGATDRAGTPLFAAEFSEIVAVSGGNYAVKKGETYAVLRVENGEVVYPAGQALSSAELYTGGYFIAVTEDGKGAVYRDGARFLQDEVLTCDAFFAVDALRKSAAEGVAGEDRFSFSRVYVFETEAGGVSVRVPHEQRKTPAYTTDCVGDRLP